MTQFGIYLHWPYCNHICPYCDFNVYRDRAQDHRALLAAMCADIAGHKAQTKARSLKSIFFGGGTPSLLKAGDIAQLLETIAKYWTWERDIEISIEANPNNITPEKLADWQKIGINRLSIGVQSFDEAALNWLGRDHDQKSALSAIGLAKDRFAAISLDLIYARPGQNVEAWQAELQTALSLELAHYSFYQLTISPDTAFGRAVERKAWRPMPDDHQAELYQLTQNLMGEAGYLAYEISNHARTKADISRHNQLYWQAQDWAGIGPGAHGRLSRDGQRIATQAEKKPTDYIAAVQDNGVGWGQSEKLSPADQASEILIMGLRERCGVDLRQLACLGFAPERHAMLELSEGKWIGYDQNRLWLEDRGKLLADHIATRLCGWQ